MSAAPMMSASLPLPDLYARVRHHVPTMEWPFYASDIEAILALKRAAQRGHPGPQLPDT